MRSSEPRFCQENIIIPVRFQNHADQRFLRAPKPQDPGVDVAKVNPNASLTERRITSKATRNSLALSTRSLHSVLSSLKLQNTIGLSVCFFCCGDHTLDLCEKFGGLRSPDEKLVFLKERGLCFACLRKGHMSKDCKNRLSCTTCYGTHPTVLHRKTLEEITADCKFILLRRTLGRTL